MDKRLNKIEKRLETIEKELRVRTRAVSEIGKWKLMTLLQLLKKENRKPIRAEKDSKGA